MKAKIEIPNITDEERKVLTTAPYAEALHTLFAIYHAGRIELSIYNDLLKWLGKRKKTGKITQNMSWREIIQELEKGE